MNDEDIIETEFGSGACVIVAANGREFQCVHFDLPAGSRTCQDCFKRPAETVYLRRVDAALLALIGVQQ